MLKVVSKNSGLYILVLKINGLIRKTAKIAV